MYFIGIATNNNSKKEIPSKNPNTPVRHEPFKDRRCAVHFI